MRKKSHIALAQYIAENMRTNELQAHRKAFCLGSILPDCKPSFVTTKHEFQGTFEKIKDDMRNLTEDCNLWTRNERVYWRRLGEVIHYIADYFTFPHNVTFGGSLKEHCDYEQELKLSLKDYVKNNKSGEFISEVKCFHNLDQLFHYISEQHKEYLSRKRSVNDDIRYILTVCFQVVNGIVQLLNQRAEERVRGFERIAIA